jgi:hypothetical protein
LRVFFYPADGGFSETSINIYQTTWCHIPEGTDVRILFCPEDGGSRILEKMIRTYVSTRLHGVTFQKTVIFIVTAVRMLFCPEDGGSRILEKTIRTYVSTRLYGVTFQKTVIFIVTAVRMLFCPEDGGSRILEKTIRAYVSTRLHGVTFQKTIVRILSHIKILHVSHIVRGHAVAYLVEALCYKSEGRGFDSR